MGNSCSCDGSVDKKKNTISSQASLDKPKESELVPTVVENKQVEKNHVNSNRTKRASVGKFITDKEKLIALVQPIREDEFFVHSEPDSELNFVRAKTIGCYWWVYRHAYFNKVQKLALGHKIYSDILFNLVAINTFNGEVLILDFDNKPLHVFIRENKSDELLTVYSQADSLGKGISQEKLARFSDILIKLKDATDSINLVNLVNNSPPSYSLITPGGPTR
jgi:hypothetical protein